MSLSPSGTELSQRTAGGGRTQTHEDANSFPTQYLSTSHCETEKPSTLKSLECSSHAGPAEKDPFNTKVLTLRAENVASSVDEN